MQEDGGRSCTVGRRTSVRCEYRGTGSWTRGGTGRLPSGHKVGEGAVGFSGVACLLEAC